MDDKYEKIKIHFFYCILILVIAIIAIATDRWTAQKDFTAYLSNAATMTSLLLGLVAIFYSFISNDGLSKSLGNIATVSDEVKQSKNEISQYLELTKSSTDTARANADSINRVSEHVTATLSTLQDALDAVKFQTETLNANVISLPARFDQLESSVNLATKSLEEKKAVPLSSVAAKGELSGDGISDGVARRFLASSALVYNFLMYACVLSKQKNVSFSLNKFCMAINYSWNAPFAGFIACMASIGLVDIDYDVSYPDFKMQGINSVLEAETESYIQNYLLDRYKNESLKQEELMSHFKNVQAIFD